jgi:hypothetical protein
MKRPKKLPRDSAQRAKAIVDLSIAEEPDPPLDQPKPIPDGKNPNAVALGRLGGKVGGKSRAAKLTPEERSAIAKRAAAARWRKKN